VLQWAFKLKRDEHNDFCFCFQSQEQAHRWFDALSQVWHHPACVILTSRMMLAWHTAPSFC
jgi:hypothetical protein